MAVASRNAILGAAIFAGAAGVCGMFANLLWFPIRPDDQLGMRLLSVAEAAIAPGVAAGLSFALLNWLGWRLRRGPLVARAAVLGTATVVGAHLLIGVVVGFIMLLEGVALSDRPLDFSTIATVSFFVSLFAATFVLVTVPAGIGAALWVETLEESPAAKRGDEAKVAE